MRFVDMVNNQGLEARAVQADYADAVSEGLNNTRTISFLQADTGIGKSLGYCVPAAMILARNPKARVVICSNTIALLRQLDQKDLPSAIEIVAHHTGYRAKHALLLGRQNFISQARLTYALDELSESQREAHTDAINHLTNWDDAIDLFIEEHGELPAGLTPNRICQTCYVQDPWYDGMKRTALSANILVCSHAMLVTDILLGGNLLFSGENADKPTYLIVDEADQLHAMLVERQQTRLNLVDLKREIAPYAKPSLLTRVEELSATVQDLADDHTFHSTELIRKDMREHLKNLIHAMHGYKQDEMQAIKAHLTNLLGQTLSRMGVGVSPVRKDPAIVFINPFLSRVFEQYAINFYQAAVLTSGTLSTFSDPNKGTQWLRRDLGVSDANIGVIGSFSPEHYGHLSITLAGPDFPKPFLYSDEVELNPHWIAAVTKHVDQLSGAVLVLTGSHAESRHLKQNLGQGTLHLPGEKLSSVVKHHLASDEKVLITAAGKVGLDLRNPDGSQYLEHVVLTRVPFAPRDPHYEHELGSYIQATHPRISNPYAFVRSTQYLLSLNTAIRQIKQSIGRGIRHEDDDVTFHLLDPRFPVYDSVSGDHHALRAAIPGRFWAEYQSADVLQGAPDLEEIEIW